MTSGDARAAHGRMRLAPAQRYPLQGQSVARRRVCHDPAAHAHQPLRDPPGARPGRHGDRLPRRGPGAAASGRAQGPPGRYRRPARAIPARGPDRRPSPAPQHRRHLRGGRARAAALHRDGVHRGGAAVGRHPSARPLEPAPQAADGAPTCAGPGVRAPRRRRPPRREALEPHGQQRLGARSACWTSASRAASMPPRPWA